MATKSAQPKEEKIGDVEEALDILEQSLDRTKVMYEQYFLGIQKQAPAQLHSEVERRIRDLAQMNIRNTALRYRFATVQQKFGSYNAYWRRTLRQIESGKYLRNLSKIGRNAARTGEEIPDEILNAMPKRMREQVKRDREMALANAARRGPKGEQGEKGEFTGEDATQEDLILDAGADLVVAEEDVEDEAPVFIKEPTELRRSLRRQAGGAHVVSEADSDLDLDAFFAQVAGEKDEDPSAPRFRPSVATTPRPATPSEPPNLRASVSSATRGHGSTTPPPSGGTRSGGEPIPRAQTQPRGSAGGFTPAPKTTSVGIAAVPRPPARAATPVPGTVPTTRPTPAAFPVPGAPSRPTPAAFTAPSAPPTRPTPAAFPAPPSPTTRPTPAAIPVPKLAPIPPAPARIAPSQVTRPNPIAPGSSNRPPVPVETLAGPFPRAESAKPKSEPDPGARSRPPVGMTEADVNNLYSKYIKAREMVGEETGPAARDKLLKTIHAQAPKIMEQYKAKGVDFSVVVKDNQVIIRAKPKT